MIPSLSLLCLTISQLSGDGSSAELGRDKRLLKPIVVREVMVPLATIAQDLTRQIAVPLEVAPNIRDRKVTLVSKNRSSAEVLGKLAEALFMEWAPVNGGYRLRLTDTAKSLEARQEDFDRNAGRELIGGWLKRVEKYGNETRDAANSAYLEAVAKKNAPNLSAEERDAVESRLRDLPASCWLEVADTLRKNPGLVARLSQGLPVVVSSDPSDGLPAITTSRLLTSAFGGKRYEAKSAIGRVSFDPDRSVLSFCVVPRFEASPPDPPFTFELPMESGKDAGPLSDAVAKWGIDGDPSVSGKAIAANPEIFPIPGYRSTLASLSDHLVYLSEVTGTLIVSDAFRRASSPDSPYGAPTVGKYLALIGSNLPNGQKVGAFRTGKGWLMVRHAAYWRMQAAEPPEELLVRLEEKIRSKGFGDIDDYAELANKLSASQRSFFDHFPLVRFSSLPFRQCWGGLLVWSSLQASQKAAAQRDGLPVSALSGSQATLLAGALSDYMWKGYVPPAAAKMCLRGTFDANEVLFGCTLTDSPPFQDPEIVPTMSGATTMNSFTNGPRISFGYRIGPQTYLSSTAWLDRYLATHNEESIQR